MSATLLNNRYELQAQQGSGGMAVIYRAIDRELGRTVAVKILRPSLSNDPEFLKRFKNEARNVANLSHPNIVGVYDVGNDGRTHFIVMEFVDGSDLKKLVRSRGALPVDLAVDLGIQICAGIGFAHRSNLVHSDVKPQNILLTRDNQVKVTDFGIAQALQDTMPNEQRAAVVWGSPHYFAPEQARGERPRRASDVYSIGIVLFELLTGQLPYTGTNQQELAMAHIREEIPRVSDVNPNVPESLSRIIHKVMNKVPNDRYSMADQLGQILVEFRDRGRQHTAVGQRPVPTFDPPAPKQSSPPVPPVPPPPAQQQQAQPPQPNRPLYRQPSAPQAQPPANSEPTQRYDVAPQAPNPSPYNRQGPPPSPFQQEGAASVPAPAPIRPDTGAMFPTGTGTQPPVRQDSMPIEAQGGLDLITIILALLAFVAVACLIPLYILVFQAYFGG